MSIASEIMRIQGNISDAYTAAQAKGATIPATQNSDNLATTISTISGGGGDTTGWIPKAIDANGKLVGSSTAPNFTGVEDIGDYVLYYSNYQNTRLTGAVSFPDLTTVSGNNAMSGTFSGCTGLTSVSFPALTTISGSYGFSAVFRGCTGLTSVDLSALTTISGNNAMSSTFSGCTGLTSVSFPALTTISGSYGIESTFYGCTGLTSVSFPALTTISGSRAMNNTFDGCTGLTSVSFPALTTISSSRAMNNTFYYCTGLTSVSFPALKSNSFGSNKTPFGDSSYNYCFVGVSGCTIHFPSNLDPQTGSTVISSLSGYPNFGGTNTVLAFDLPATE